MNPNEKITHKVSAEAAGRFERWMTEAEERWRKGVLIISEENKKIYFLLMVKCGVIAKYINVPEKSLVCYCK